MSSLHLDQRPRSLHLIVYTLSLSPNVALEDRQLGAGGRETLTVKIQKSTTVEISVLEVLYADEQ